MQRNDSIISPDCILGVMCSRVVLDDNRWKAKNFSHSENTIFWWRGQWEVCRSQHLLHTVYEFARFRTVSGFLGNIVSFIICWGAELSRAESVVILCAIEQGTLPRLSHIFGQSRRFPRGVSKNEDNGGTQFGTTLALDVIIQFRLLWRRCTILMLRVWRNISGLSTRKSTLYWYGEKERHFLCWDAHKAASVIFTYSRATKCDVSGLENFGQRVRKSSLGPQTQTFAIPLSLC